MSQISMSSLYRSTFSLKNETEKVTRYIDNHFKRIVFYPLFFDFDYKVYCDHYNGLVHCLKQLPPDPSNNLIKEKAAELPSLQHNDFRFATFGLPIPVLYTILFPLGLVALGKNQATLSALQEKLGDINRILGTTEFVLKAAVS